MDLTETPQEQGSQAAPVAEPVAAIPPALCELTTEPKLPIVEPVVVNTPAGNHTEQAAVEPSVLEVRLPFHFVNNFSVAYLANLVHLRSFFLDP